MSFILEALRKSERERERRSLPGVAEAVAARVPAPRLPWLLGALSLLLLVNVVVVGWLLLRPAPPLPPATLPAASSALEARAPSAAALPRRIRPLGAEVAAPAPPPPPELAPRPTAARAPVVTAAGLPLLSELPPELSAGLAQLRVELHVYSIDAAQRFIVINGQRLVEGGQLREGATLERITPDGAVLSVRGSRFRLPRD